MNQEDQYVHLNPGETQKLTEWKKEPTILDLAHDLSIAKESHDAHSKKVQHWLDLRNVTGSAKPKTLKNRSSVQPPLIRKQNEWRYSALSEPFLSSDGMFEISPRTWEDKQGAEQNQLVLNWQFRTKIDSVDFIDKFVRTVVDEGTVAVRLGWERQTRMVKKTVPVWGFYVAEDEEELLALQEAMLTRKNDPRGFTKLPPELQAAAEYSMEQGVPVVAVQVGEEEVEEEEIIRNRPTLDFLHYENLYLDPTCQGDISKARFAIISFETSYAELKKEGKKYKNLDQIDYNSNNPIMVPDHEVGDTPTSIQFKDKARKRIVAYEYWGWYDVEGDGVLVPIVATYVGNTIIRMEENPFPDKSLPIVLTKYLPVKNSLTGEPDAELLEDNQKVLGAVTRGMIDLMARSANGQTGFAKGMLDPVNRRRYDAGADYEFNPNLQPSAGIYAHKYPEIPQSALTMLSLQNQEAESLTGVKAFSGGLSGEAYGEVAAGIRGMLDAASKREMAILRRLAKGIAEIGKKIISMNQEFLSEEEVIRVTNEDFVTISREELRGDYDLKVDISTAEVDEAKAQDLAFMLQTMGNNMDFSMVQMVLAEIAKLKRMPELAEKILSFQPQPDPLDQQLKQLEIRKLQAEVQKTEADAQLSMAKARKELSEADLKDLDYVEQETGTKHERDRDLHGAQAEANQKHEITKAFLAPQKEGESRPDIAGAVAYNQFTKLLDGVVGN
jgi:hypothetical protein